MDRLLITSEDNNSSQNDDRLQATNGITVRSDQFETKDTQKLEDMDDDEYY